MRGYRLLANVPWVLELFPVHTDITSLVLLRQSVISSSLLRNGHLRTLRTSHGSVRLGHINSVLFVVQSSERRSRDIVDAFVVLHDQPHLLGIAMLAPLSLGQSARSDLRRKANDSLGVGGFALAVGSVYGRSKKHRLGVVVHIRFSAVSQQLRRPSIMGLLLLLLLARLDIQLADIALWLHDGLVSQLLLRLLVQRPGLLVLALGAPQRLNGVVRAETSQRVVVMLVAHLSVLLRASGCVLETHFSGEALLALDFLEALRLLRSHDLGRLDVLKLSDFGLTGLGGAGDTKLSDTHPLDARVLRSIRSLGDGSLLDHVLNSWISQVDVLLLPVLGLVHRLLGHVISHKDGGRLIDAVSRRVVLLNHCWVDSQGSRADSRLLLNLSLLATG